MRERFIKKFGNFYLYSKTGNYISVRSKVGEKLSEIDLEINAKKPTTSGDIIAFIESELDQVKKEERQFILNVLDGIDIADELMGNTGGGTKTIRFALRSRYIGDDS